MLTIYIALDRTGYIIPLIISISVHEAAHVLCLKLFKCRIRNVRLLFGTLSIEYNSPPSDVARLISLLSGPLINLIISGVSYLLNYNTFCAINLLLFIYNLLPLNCLDGGEIAEIILERFLTHKQVSAVLNILTIIICILLVVACFGLTRNFSFIILCFYLLSVLIFKKTLKDVRF